MESNNSLRRNPEAGSFFARRITSTKALQRVIENSAFVGLDTEYALDDSGYIPHQVGVAYMATLSTGVDSSSESLEHFSRRKDILSTTINVAPRQGDNLRRPLRRPSRFGRECLSTFEKLDEFLNDLLEYYKAMSTAQGKGNIVLVLFEYPAEWAFIAQFPSMTRYFSEWVDVRDLAHEIAPKGKTPSLGDTLKVFGYSRWDVRPTTNKCEGHGNAHNAGNDAVMTLAVLENILAPSNQDRLRFKQACRQIISRSRIPATTPFVANIQALDGNPLPEALNSSAKVVRHYLTHYHPIQIGISSFRNAEWDQVEQTRQPMSAWISFKSLDDLNNFVRNTQFTTIDERVLGITSLYDSKLVKADHARRKALKQE
ncbi:hypothetical protein F4819DRAFT_506940 [Hypoxylon fuscum]|nr:hypothetical protein F4819DRAFT_506940 [Hypoxylon fuscum]